MPIEITMPRLSDTMEQGTIVSWAVSEGDSVSAGDALGDIETDKATMELQSFDDGVVAALILGEGQTVDVGALILVLAEEGEDPAEVRAQYAAGVRAGARETHTASVQAAQGAGGVSETVGDDRTTTVPAHGDGRIVASPLARKIAAERGIDLGAVRGTGAAGRITKKDVESAIAGPATATPPPAAVITPSAPPSDLTAGRVSQPAAPPELPGAGELPHVSVPLSNMRRTIARRLVESTQGIPHYQVTVTVRMDALMSLREQFNEQLVPQGVKLSVNDFLIRACALAMHQHPFVNSSWGSDGSSIEVHDRVNIGVAIALPVQDDLTGGGLVVGVLRDADRMGLRTINETTKQLATKARDRGLSIEEMEGSTFTVSNLGMFGVEHFTAIINPPNVAILAVGGAVKKPVVDDEGGLTVGHEMSMTMASDHRVIDGAMAAQYLASVKQMLESPATLLV